MVDRVDGSDDQVQWIERASAVEQLGRIDGDRETVRLIGEGWGDEWIAEHRQEFIGRVRGIRAKLNRGEEIRPVTPYELGLRRHIGQISTEEMMERLRVWPYEFGVVHDDFYESKLWDDVETLNLTGLMTDGEYSELRAIVERRSDFPS